MPRKGSALGQKQILMTNRKKEKAKRVESKFIVLPGPFNIAQAWQQIVQQLRIPDFHLFSFPDQRTKICQHVNADKEKNLVDHKQPKKG